MASRIGTTPEPHDDAWGDALAEAVGAVAEKTIAAAARRDPRVEAALNFQPNPLPGPPAENEVVPYSRYALAEPSSHLHSAPDLEEAGQAMTAAELLVASQTRAPDFRRPRTPLADPFAPGAYESGSPGARVPTTLDGTPLYRQGDPDWAFRQLGAGKSAPTIGARGCAITATAMALSKLSGQTRTPAMLDAYLDEHQGYAGNRVVWDVAAKWCNPQLAATSHRRWDIGLVDEELARGRPVVVGVDYKDGASGGQNGTDHWLCLTRRDEVDRDLYYANDPATGAEISLRRLSDGRLFSERATQPYCTSGDFVTFGSAAPTHGRRATR